jgi:hypothetical protein
LFTPLDWGLGHTTRCIPLIRQFLEHGHLVTVAVSEPHNLLIREAFPDVEILKLEGYKVKYAKNPRFFPIKMALQFPKILLRHFRDRLWIKNLLLNRTFDIIISDNRYAMFHDQAKSIIITHQLEIKTGKSALDKLVQGFIYKWIERFDECLIPDFEGAENLAGALSHPKTKPDLPLKYLGPLSRFVLSDEKVVYDLAILISGPEPQRSLFELQMITQLQDCKKKVLLVRGLPKGKVAMKLNHPNVEVCDHLGEQELNQKILQSQYVVCRSGYSTLMDLYILRKSATIIPTPGQSEQEYLAKHLDGKYGFTSIEQKQLNLKDLLDQIH